MDTDLFYQPANVYRNDIGVKQPNQPGYVSLNIIAKDYILKVVPSVFLVILTVSNILSIIVLTKKEIRKQSIFCYFTILCILTIIKLYQKYIRTILDFHYGNDIRQYNVVGCRIIVFLTYFLNQSQSLILTAISIDRVVYVLFWNKAKILCTPKAAIIGSTIVMGFDFIMNAHLLYGRVGFMKTENNKTFFSCNSVPGTSYQYFTLNGFKVIDLTLSAFVPFIVMFICSIIIIIKVALTSNFHNGNLINNFIERTLNSSKLNCCVKPTTRSKTVDTLSSSKSRKLEKVASVLIPVDIAFLIFMSPRVLVWYLYPDIGKDLLTQGVVEFFYDAFWVFSFVIYYFTNSKFRKEFHSLFKHAFKCCFKNSS